MEILTSNSHSFINKTANYFTTLCLFISLILSVRAHTQDLNYENFGVDDGLPSSEVYDVYQDKEGYIWFATDKGLSRYNGYEFENFNTSDGLPGNVILRFYPQSNGQIWCYTFHSKSLFYFDEIFNGFKQYKYNDVLKEELEKSSVVKSVYLDKEDNLRIGGHSINGEITILNNGQVKTQYQYENYYSDTILSKSIVLNPILDTVSTVSFFTKIDTDQNKNHLFQSVYSSSRISAKWLVENEIAIFMTSEYVKLLFKNQDEIILKAKKSIAGIKVIDRDHFFIGYEFGGGKIYDKKGNCIREILFDESVSNFLVDHEGGFWFTTLNSGVFYANNPSFTIYNSVSKKSHHVNSMVKTSDDALVVGYKDGKISTVIKNIENFENGTPKRTIHAFVEYDPLLNKKYTYSNLYLKENVENKTLISEYIINLSEPNNKSIFASFDGGFYEINENNVVKHYDSPYRLHDVCVWKKDTLLATPIGVMKLQNNEFIPLSEQSYLFSFRVEDIDVSSNNDMLYVATHGAGVVVNDGNCVFNIDEEDGLNSNIVNEIHVENDSTFWACTNRGINRIILNEHGIMISAISKKDGLLSNEVEDIEIMNDTVWVGTKQGLCNFPKSQLKPKTIDVSNLKLKDVIVNDGSQKHMNQQRLPYKENKIEFLLEGISYAFKENVRYRYRLNKKQNWSSTQNRSIQFSSLAPGNYVFEAKMCIDGQNCSEKTITYKFTILAPFWKRWWFILLGFFLVSLLIYTFFKIRVLTYNKDVIREFIRLINKKLKKEEMYFSFRENGNHVRVKTEEILYVKSAGNYIDLFTTTKTHTIRLNIGKFLAHVPDRLEYVRLHRSYIVRIDKIMAKSKNEVRLIDGIKIPVSINHHKRLKEVVF